MTFEFEVLRLYGKYIRIVNGLRVSFKEKLKEKGVGQRRSRQLRAFEDVFLQILVQLYMAKFDFNHSDQILSRSFGW